MDSMRKVSHQYSLYYFSCLRQNGVINQITPKLNPHSESYQSINYTVCNKAQYSTVLF